MKISLAILCGLIVGFLINYFSDVLPASRRLGQPSCCNCGSDFMILDYIFFKRCSKCGKKRSTRSIVVMILSILVSVLLVYFPFSNLNFFASLPILVFMGMIVVIDFENRLVLIQTSFFGLFLFLLYGIIKNGFITTITGGLTGLLIMLFFYFSGKLLIFISGKLRGKKINEVAFGLGDVFFGTILGFLTGYPVIIGATVVTMLLFLIFSLFLFLYLLLNRKYQAYSLTLPFTTFQVVGVVAFFYLYKIIGQS